MTRKAMQLDPRIGDAVCKLLERETGEEVHIILIAFAMDGEKLGHPAFITSLTPDDMEDALIQIAGNFAVIGKEHRTITGKYEQ